MSEQEKQKLLKDFREKFLMKGSECTWEVYPEPEELESYLLEKVAEAKEEEHKLCKKVYIENVDWSEWGISDEEAAENFEEEYAEIQSQVADKEK